MCARRAITTSVLAATALLVLTAPAEARLTWRSCPEAAAARCATVRVPLDRSGSLDGRVDLHVARVAFARRRDSFLMYLSGGPGGAGVYEMLDVLFELPRLARRYTVIGFDQRGTGASGLLRCRALERDSRLRSTEAAERCARELGTRRSFYTTPDTVADMETIRKAVGARTLTLFGISYGTELALAYSRAYPGRVDRMILDSVVDPDESDPFGLAGFRAMGPSLAALCPARCRGVSADPGADLVALTAKLRAAPLSGSWYDARGRRHSGTLRPIAIADLLYDADYNPALRAGVPMAVRAALDNDDAAPMLRLLAGSDAFTVPSDPRDFSAARYAVVCEETPLPWPRGTGIADRFAIARARALALPGSAFAPFDAEVAYADEIDLCLRWPDSSRPPRVSGGAYPAVPTLLLQGEEDLRTPPEVSAHVATLIAGARRVTAPGVGHAVIGVEQLRPPPAVEVRRGQGRARTLPAGPDRRPRDGRAAGLVRRARTGARAQGPGGEDGECRRCDTRLPRLRALTRAEPRPGRRWPARRLVSLWAAAVAERCAGRAGRARQRLRAGLRHAVAARRWRQGRRRRGARDAGRAAERTARPAAGLRTADEPPAAAVRVHGAGGVVAAASRGCAALTRTAAAGAHAASGGCRA